MTDLLALSLIIILLTTVGHGTGRDDTDEPHGRHSGMTVYTDYGTGCQYIGTVLGGISPRLGADGKPICAKRQ